MIATVFATLLYFDPSSFAAPWSQVPWTTQSQNSIGCTQSSDGIVSICDIPSVWEEDENADLSRTFRTKDGAYVLDIFIEDGFGHNGEIEGFGQSNTHSALEIAATNLLNKLAGGSVYSEVTLVYKDVFVLETFEYDPEVRYLSYSAEAVTDVQTIAIIVENTDERYDEFALHVEELRDSLSVYRIPLSRLLTNTIVNVQE